MIRAALLGALAALAACGSDQPGPQVTGSVNGFAYAMSYALVLNNTANDGSSSTTLVLTTDSDLCAKGNVDASLGYEQLAIIDLGVVTPAGIVVAPGQPGTFDVDPATVEPGTNLADGEAISLLASSCATDAIKQAQSGSVTVTNLDIDDGGVTRRLAGTVDLGFSDGGALAGPFDATWCDGQFELTYDPCRR